MVGLIGGMEWRHWRIASPGSGGNGGDFDAVFTGEELVQSILLVLVNHGRASPVVLTTRSAFQNSSGSSYTGNDVQNFAQVRYRSSMKRCIETLSVAKFGL